MDPGASLDVEQPHLVSFLAMRLVGALSNMAQCNLHSPPDCSLKARPRLRPHRTLHPPNRHLVLLTRHTRESLLVGATNMQRYNHDVARCMGLPVARIETYQLREQACGHTATCSG